MRTKLFVAFFVVVLTALVSNFIFERLIIHDFDDYAMGQKEDRLYWVLASLEGSHAEGTWDKHSLAHTMHWGMILGYDLKVLDDENMEIASSVSAMEGATNTMRRRIEALAYPEMASGDYEEYPLFVEGQEIGTLMVRDIVTRGPLKAKAKVFKQRGRNFLIISFLIAGGGAAFLSIVFSVFLSSPLRKLKSAALRVGGGDLSVRIKGSKRRDEVGELIHTFNHMVESLGREETLRQHLTSNIAHELRTPLTIMKSHLEAASDGVVELNQDTVSSLATEVERLIDLVEGIEDMTKAEASFLKPAEYVEVNLSEYIKELALGMHALDEKGLELEFELKEAQTVTIDAEKVETVFRNLLSNALRVTESGTITVRTGSVDSGFYFEVSDTGPGIDKQAQVDVFKRFNKGAGSTGRGLGLAIAKELVGVMDGRIELDSAKGRGATFKVTINQRP